MTTESKAEYASRVARQTAKWMLDRSEHLPRIAYDRIDAIRDLCAAHLTAYNPDRGIRLAKLSKKDQAVVEAKIAGYIYAERGNRAAKLLETIN